MSVKSDRWIRRMALERRMIEPFVEAQKREGVISYGLSSYGYDMRVGGRSRWPRWGPGASWIPNGPAPEAFMDVQTDSFVEIPPHGIALANRWNIFASLATS
jgi:dCTP deaminase